MLKERKAIILEYFACPVYIAIQFLLDDEDIVRVVSGASWEFGLARQIAVGITYYNNTYQGDTTLDILERACKEKLVFPVVQSTENPKLILIKTKGGN